MKSEERHQLLTNDLGVVTTKTVGFFERHLGTIVGFVGAALLVTAIGFWWTRKAETDVEAGWTLLDSASSLEEFGNVVDKYQDKPAGQWAQLIVSETNLKTAMPLMFSNREIALTDIKSARQGFETLLNEKSAAPLIRERALWGLALCLETTCDGNTAKVVEAYEKLLKDFPETIFKAVAEERIASLKRDSAKDFYAWFSKEEPKPPEARPRDFKSEGNGGFDFSNSKDEGADFIPGLKSDPLKSSSTPPESGEKPDASGDAVEKSKPVDENKPAAEDKPAGEEKSEAPADPAKSSEEPTKKD